MILAAGYGQRLWPLTADRTKPALPVLGKPLVGYVADYLATYGIEDVVVTGLEAGVDAMMVTSGLDRQLAAAKWIADRVRPERIQDALRRATWFRERFGRTALDVDFDDDPRRELANEIAAASITHVGPPLPRLEDAVVRVAYFEPKQASPVEELSTPASTFEAALRRHFGERVTFTTDRRAPRGAGVLVVCSTNAWFEPEQATRVKVGVVLQPVGRVGVGVRVEDRHASPRDHLAAALGLRQPQVGPELLL